MLVAYHDINRLLHASEVTPDTRKQAFFCPVCRNAVIYRAGVYTIPHFAHVRNQSCSISVEPETKDHLMGKQRLYKWLETVADYAQLEKHLKELNQRPDIYVRKGKKTYAFEYQCSSISSELYNERTHGYFHAGIEPIWIFHQDFLKRKGAYEWTLNSLLQAALRIDDKYSPYLLFYHPHQPESLLQLYNLSPFTKNTWFGQIQRYDLRKEKSMDIFLKPTTSAYKYLAHWFRKRERFMETKLRYQGFKNPLNREIYNYGWLPHLLPPIIGVPLPSNHFVYASPMDWQGLVILDLNDIQSQTGRITVWAVKELFLKRVERKQIQWSRTFQSVENKLLVIEEFIHFLEKAEYLRKIHGNHYIIEGRPYSVDKLQMEYEQLSSIVEGICNPNGEKVRGK